MAGPIIHHYRSNPNMEVANFGDDFMRILVLSAHPDEGSFCDAVAAAYVDGARAAGHEVRGIALRELRFDLVLRGGFHSAKPLDIKVMAVRVLRQGACAGERASAEDHSG